MNQAFTRCAALMFALISPLVMTSCISHEKSVPTQTYSTAECQSCAAFSVSVWHVSADLANLKDLFPAQDNTTESLNSEVMNVIDAARAEAIMQRLKHDRRSAFVGKAWNTTTAGKSALLSINSASGAFSAEITAGPQTQKLTSRVVKLSLSDSIPDAESLDLEDKAWMNGRFLLRDGDTVLLIQHMRNGWVVWLIGAKFSA